MSKSQVEKLNHFQIPSILEEWDERELNEILISAIKIIECEMAFISLIEKDQQYIVAQIEANQSDLIKYMTFCNYIKETKEVLVIEDTRTNDKYDKKLNITNFSKNRFFAGFPLIDHNNQFIGSLCLLDRSPKELSQKALKTIEGLTNNIRKENQNRAKNNHLIDVTTHSELINMQKVTGEDFLSRLIKSFINNYELFHIEINELFKNKDFEKMKMRCHSARPNAFTLGATKLGEKLSDIETSIIKGEVVNGGDIKEVESLLNSSIAELKEILDQRCTNE